MNIGIYVYPNAEVLDFAGPFEVFSTANRLGEQKDAVNVFLVSEKPGPLLARGGLQIIPHYSFADHPTIDVLIVVGGIHDEEMGKASVLAWIAAQSSRSEITASVCTGVFLLAGAGVVTDQRVTTHWQDMDDLKKQFPALQVCEGVRWIDCGAVVSSAGISAGIDMSLHLVARLRSPDLARKTAKQMEFDWPVI
ncbi:DJ-1/PfpI family protein [Zhongshania sp.]|uniref:DJ-1/PfpI family protein n=1 Tax=Zhongshania sp. TaxID=1971902 RepID=UPI003567E3E3